MKLRASSIFTKAAVFSLAVYATVSLMGLCVKIDEAEQQKDELRYKVDQLTQENARLQYNLENSDDPATIEEIARDKLGLVRPGEKIFYDVSD